MSIKQKTDALASALADLITEIAASPDSKPATSSAKGKTTSSAKGKSEITVDDLAEDFGNYLTTGNAAAKKKAKQVVQAIVAHFDAERVTKLDPENFEEAKEMLSAYKNGDDPLELFEDDEDEDDGSPI